MVLKCKICGGALEMDKIQRIITCPYCGVQQTLPNTENEKIANLYDRANHFLRNNDYDKAQALFETILDMDSTDGEVYWSLVLCKYGVEFVKDPKKKEYIPTCNKTRTVSIFADDDYLQALENSTEEQQKIYKKQAQEINEIQKRILELSNKEKPYDVFICYKEKDKNGERTEDSVLAQEIYSELTKEGLRVFFSRISLEGKLGMEYEPYIYAALNSAKVMIVVGTQKEYFEAPWVRNEWTRYLNLMKESDGKNLIPCYKYIDAYDLPKEFAHLQAQDMNKIGFKQDLVRGVQKLAVSEPRKQKKENDFNPFLIIIIVMMIVGIIYFVISKNDNLNNSSNKINTSNSEINTNSSKTTTESAKSILREDFSATGGYTFNIKGTELKEKIMKKMATTKYADTIEAKEYSYDNDVIAIGWIDTDPISGAEETTGIQISLDEQGYVYYLECLPSRYGSGDMSSLNVPVNLYEEAKRILGSETDEWKKLVNSGKIEEKTFTFGYDDVEPREVTDGSFYAGMFKYIAIK